MGRGAEEGVKDLDVNRETAQYKVVVSALVCANLVVGEIDTITYRRVNGISIPLA